MYDMYIYIHTYLRCILCIHGKLNCGKCSLCLIQSIHLKIHFDSVLGDVDLDAGELHMEILADDGRKGFLPVHQLFA